MNALTDGVIAIALTIIVLELPVPKAAGMAGLREVAPTLLIYLLSFVGVGIFWNNHHHMMATAHRVDGGILWRNLGMLFFISMTPFAIRWMTESDFAALPVAGYGMTLLGASVCYQLMSRAIIALEGDGSILARAVGGDRKGALSLAAYAAAVGLAFVQPLIAIAIYAVVAAVWLIPDRRIERQVIEEHGRHPRH